jgi:hypothetical protein
MEWNVCEFLHLPNILLQSVSPFGVFRFRDDAAMITALNCVALGQPSHVVGSDNSGLRRVGFKFCSFCAPIGSAGWPFKHKTSPLVGKLSLLCT